MAAGSHPVLQLGNSKCEQSPEEEDRDRISLLPTEILAHILSFLDLKEAARTSLLSKRWIRLWVLAAVQLDFDATKVLIELVPSSKGSKFYEDYFGNLIKKTPQYLEWVNKVVQVHQVMAIEKFRICFELDKSSQHHIDQWLLYAFARKVQKLQLNFLCLDHPLYLITEPYLFPSCRFLDQKSSESPSIIHHEGISTLTVTDLQSLRSVSLEGVDVTGETVNFFITKFHFLERLVISGSRSRDLSTIVVCGNSSLKHMELTFCKHLRSLVVRDSCLVSLKITWVRDLVLESVPMLVDLMVQELLYVMIKQLSSSVLSRLEILTLHAIIGDIEESIPWFLPQLSSLKQLNVYICRDEDVSLLHFISSFVRSSPTLEKIVIKSLGDIYRRSKRKFEQVSSCQPLERLKVVEFGRYMGRKADDELVMYFLMNSPALEKIIIDPTCPTIIYRQCVQNPYLEKMARFHAENLFKGLPVSSLELVIL